MDVVHSRLTDEQLLIHFLEDQGLETPALLGAIERLNNCIAKGLQDYSVPDKTGAKLVEKKIFSRKYRLVCDNSNTWYVIPVGSERVFSDWVKAQESGDFNDPYGDKMVFPSFESMLVESPHKIIFEKYCEG